MCMRLHHGVNTNYFIAQKLYFFGCVKLGWGRDTYKATIYTKIVPKKKEIRVQVTSIVALKEYSNTRVHKYKLSTFLSED